MRKWLTLLLLTTGAAGVYADEGVWLYNQFPKDKVSQKYGFTVTDEFLNHLRLSSVRLGASASFVSPNGLILTNHHVASGCIQRLSTAAHNYTANGFNARTESEELKCPAMEANVLVNITDVTAAVNAAVKAKPGTPDANTERRAVTNKIESDCAARTGGHCEVVTLYSGALYHLYEYKKYTDVRLVFAPEKPIAFFGGDPDNFTYPRYDLDITFLRAYENGQPASSPNYLRWSHDGAKEGELAFVSGHPGSTDRFITVAEYEYLRDTEYPLSLAYLDSTIKTLLQYSDQSAENKRVADDKLFGAQNSYKARYYEEKGMKSAALATEKKAREDRFREALAKFPRVNASLGNAWDEIAAAYRLWTPELKAYRMLEVGPSFSDLFRIARTVLRLPEEKAKPNAERLREFSDANLASLEMRLYSPAPIHDTLEVAVLANWLRFMQATLGAGDAGVKAALGGRTPEEAAQYYVSTTKLKDVAERKRLAANIEGVMSSEDGMIQLVRALDPAARALRKKYEDTVQAAERNAGAALARARFAVYGAGEYPDATGTLRLSFGAIKGYTNEQGKAVAPFTDFAGLYKHATGEEPFKLPDSFTGAKAALGMATPFNFASTCDIIGGNSGSPTVNTKGEFIGIVFDHNLEAMPNRFVYSDLRGRAVHVTSQGVVEALRNVYHAKRVLSELGFAE